MRGLYIGAPVTFRGVPVGQVDEIGIEIDSKSLNARIPVRVRLRPDSTRVIDGPTRRPRSADARAARAARAAHGAEFRHRAEADRPRLRARNPPFSGRAAGEPEIPALADRFGALIDQVAELPLRQTLDEVRATVRSLQTTLDETRSTVAATRGAVERSSASFDGVAREGRLALVEARGAVVGLRTEVERSLASLDAFLQSSRSAVEKAQPELQATLASARAAAAAAEQAMRRVEELTDPRAPLRGDIDAAVRDLAQATRALREWSELIEERPNALLFGRGDERGRDR